MSKIDLSPIGGSFRVANDPPLSRRSKLENSVKGSDTRPARVSNLELSVTIREKTFSPINENFTRSS